jgi:hypothetical protein
MPPRSDERKMNALFGIRSHALPYKHIQRRKCSGTTKDAMMKKTVLALTAAALLVTGFSASALADDGFYRGDRTVYLDRGDVEGVLVQDRRFYGDRREEWRREERFRDQIGPREVSRMLERRGYRVRDVNFERGRYFVQAWRRGAPVLVTVSRDGDILDTRVMGDRRGYRDRRSDNGFSIEVRPANDY